MNQLDLFAAPDTREKAPEVGAWLGQLANHAAATAAKPRPVATKRPRQPKKPTAPPVVIADPQLPPLGAVAKIDGRWHVWRKDGLIGTVQGWGVIRPPEHAAHASEQPPRLDSKGWIAEPYPADAIVHIDGHRLTVKWSEHGFAIYQGERHLLHFSQVAGCAVAAATIAQADEHFQQRLASIKVPEPDADASDDEQPKEWRFEWRGLSIIGEAGPCFRIDREKHPEGTPCFSETGFRSFCGDAWRLAPPIEGRKRSTVEWSVAILDAYFAAPAKDGNGLGGKLVPWKRHEWEREEAAEVADDEPEPAPAPKAAADEPEPLHALHQALIDAELITRYHAVTGATLQDPKQKERPAPWNAPSRLFLFPCALHLPNGDEPARLLIFHERLADHPFVREVAQVTGLEPEPNDGGFDRSFSAHHGLYHHAVDLISAGQWQQLLELRGFTEPDCIVQAVCYGLDYGHLSAKDAGQVLRAIGVAIPANPSPVDALRVVSLSEFKNENKLQRATNWMSGPGRAANAWARIAGIERGWFKLKGQFLTWTDKALVEQRNLKIAAGEKIAPLPVPEGSLL
jgi:hypothetical protein